MFSRFETYKEKLAFALVKSSIEAMIKYFFVK